MFWFLFVSVYNVLCHGTLLVTGRCMISIGTVLVPGSEESHQKSIEENVHTMETKNQNMGSAFEKLEAAVNRTNARGQEELCQDLKTLCYNMSVDLERVSEKIPERPELHIQAVNESLSATLQTVSRSLDYKVQVMNGSVVDALREHDQKLQTMNETLSSSIENINEKLNAILNYVNETLQYSKSQDHCRNTSDVYDCSDIKANGYTTSGVYRIYVVDQGQRYYANVFCDMTTTNGSWTVFQRRNDGSVDFFRGWNEYENGFGNPSGEFWLGNNFLHLLTSKKRYRLRIDLEDFEGGQRYAEYSTFNISSSADKYRLRIGNYSGNAGDSLSWHNGQRFTTKDNDNDAHSSENCAIDHRGAWWYNHCHSSNLNGLYLRGNYSSNSAFNGYEGIRWGAFHYAWYSLKTTEMKISSCFV